MLGVFWWCLLFLFWWESWYLGILQLLHFLLTSKSTSDRQGHELDRLQRKKIVLFFPFFLFFVFLWFVVCCFLFLVCCWLLFVICCVFGVHDDEGDVDDDDWLCSLSGF